MEAWAIGCSAILAKSNQEAQTRDIFDPYQFGMMKKDDFNTEAAKFMLSDAWGCESREDLISQITSLLDNGHNLSFLDTYADYSWMTDDELNEILKMHTPENAAYLRFMIDTGDKWGDKGIKAWDWFRAMQITGWGYIAGYFDIEETCGYMEQIIERIRGTFSSWDEVTQNYLDGNAFWAEEDPTDPTSMYQVRTAIYNDLKENNADLFDPSVWE